MTHYLDAAVEAAQAAGEMLRHCFQQPLRVNSSEAHDIKLEIDVRAQTLITELLLKKFPEHALYGEEGVVGDQASDHQWVVDPLDGTVNFFYGIPHFCVSIALRYMGEIIVGVIYDPTRDVLASLPKRRRFLVVGFAAETHDLKINARKKLRAKNCDAIVANDVSGSEIGMESDENEVTIFFRDGQIKKISRASKKKIGRELVKIFEKIFEKGLTKKSW